MKKGFKLLICALCAVSFIACNPSTNDKGGGNQEVAKTLQQQIDEAVSKGLVDFNNAKIEQNASVDDKITIKNLDMGDKTLTITTSGVVLENVSNATVIVADGDVTLKNCTNIKKLEVKKTSSSDSVVIDASKIDTIEINKDGIRIVLKDEKTEVKDVVVSAKNTTVEAEKKSTDSDTTKAPVIENLTVKENVDNVNVSGGKIENLKVETKDTTTNTTTKPTVTITGETEIKAIEGTDTVSVSPEVKETVKVPETVTKTEIKEFAYAIYDVKSLKTEYTIGDSFDYANLAVKVIYNNGSTKVVPLTAENCEIKGFNSEKAASLNIEVYYNTNFIGDFTVVVRKPVKTEGSAREFLDAAIEALIPVTQYKIPDVDLAVSYFKKAYETEQTDETKLYYALAEVASLSTDENVAKLLKENFGIKNYPASMNALLSGSWMKECVNLRSARGATFVKDSNGYYIRGNRKDNSYNSDLSFSSSYYCLCDDKWLECWSYRTYRSISDIEPSPTGNIMIYFSGEYKKVNEYREKYKDCIYSLDNNVMYQVPIKELGFTSTAVFPDFTVIDADDKAYQATLYNSMKTTETMAYLMYSNFFSCNADGFNKLIDNILNVFGTRYENAKALVKDFKQESVEIPSEYIVAMNLGDVLGTNTVKVGKAEVDAVFAAMDVIKGVFQWFSSYDLGMDLESTIKTPMYNLYNKNDPYNSSWSAVLTKYTASLNLENLYTNLYALTNEKTLTVRNADAMTASKVTILNAAKTALASYEYIITESKLYPDAVKTEMKKYADPVYSNVKSFAAALEAGSVYEVKLQEEKPAVLSIDLGKVFTAGYFSDLIEKNSKGNVKFTAYGYSSSFNNPIPIRFKNNKEYDFDATNISASLDKILKPETEELDWDKCLHLESVYGYVSINLSRIIDLFPGTIKIPESMSQIYDSTTGILKYPVVFNTWANLYKSLDSMEGNWFQTGFDLTELLTSWGAQDNDIVGIKVTSYVTNGSYSSMAYMGDVKTVKESGNAAYGIVNKYFGSSFAQYYDKGKLPERLNFTADDKVSPGVVKLFAYSNMSETTPELTVTLQIFKPIESTTYSSSSEFISYYDSKTEKFVYGYTQPRANSMVQLSFSKVK